MKVKLWARPIIKVAALLLSLGLVLSGTAYAAPTRVVILPFTVNAKDDLSFLVKGVRDMLASRLAWGEKVVVVEHDLVAPVLKKIKPPYNQARALKVGEALMAKVVVYGSITVLGKSVSLDARVAKVGEKKPALTAYTQAPSLDEVIPKIGDFAQRINAEIFQRPGSKVAASRAARSGGGAGGGSGSGSALDKLPPNISPLNPMFRRALTGVDSDRYWRSPRIRATITSVAVADIDMDGKNELLVLMPDRLRVYRLAAKYFALVAEFKNGPAGRYLFVDAADLDGDGRPEIFISNVRNRLVQSFVLVSRGKRLQMVAKGLPYYFRAQRNPVGKGKIVFGQKSVMDIPFSGPVYYMKYNKGEYVPDRELKLPRLANIYNFVLADLNGSGRAMYVVLDGDNQIRVYSSSGEERWVSGEQYAGSAKTLEYSPAAGIGMITQESLEWLPTRMIVTDLDGDGRQEIVVVKNSDRTGGFVDRFKLYYQGTIYGLRWNGIQMVQQWRTQKISGYLTDYLVADVGNVGRPALVIALSRTMGGGTLDMASFFTKTISNVIAFTLKAKAIKAKPKPNKGL